MSSKKTKVLLFVDRMRQGGIQQFIIENVKHMNKDKVQIDVLTLDDLVTYPLEDELKKYDVNFYKLKNVWINHIFDYVKYTKEVNNFFKNNHDYKVIHMNGSSKNFLLLKYAKKYNIKVRIVHSHNTDFQTKNIIKKIIGNILKIPMRNYATNFFACSTIAGIWLFNKKNVSNGNVKIIRNAVDYDKFKFNKETRDKIRKKLKIKNNEILIGHVGRFTNQKNHKFLIDIFKEINKKNNNTKLVLIGTGELENLIKEKVKKYELEDKVIFLGFRSDVNDLMQAMDIFLFPSLYEGLPVVLIEAQAASLPIFTSKDVVSNEVNITDKVKFISLKESSKKWADEILKCDLNRKSTYKDIKNAGYLIEDTAKELLKFYLSESGEKSERKEK